MDNKKFYYQIEDDALSSWKRVKRLFILIGGFLFTDMDDNRSRWREFYQGKREYTLVYSKPSSSLPEKLNSPAQLQQLWKTSEVSGSHFSQQKLGTDQTSIRKESVQSKYPKGTQRDTTPSEQLLRSLVRQSPAPQLQTTTPQIPVASQPKAMLPEQHKPVPQMVIRQQPEQETPPQPKAPEQPASTLSPTQNPLKKENPTQSKAILPEQPESAPQLQTRIPYSVDEKSTQPKESLQSKEASQQPSSTNSDVAISQRNPEVWLKNDGVDLFCLYDIGLPRSAIIKAHEETETAKRQYVESELPSKIAVHISTLEIQTKLDKLPECISKLPHIKDLRFLCSTLSALPAEIGNFKNLLLLQASGSQLTTLPDSIGQLSGLQTLKLMRNKLTVLPDSIGQLSNLKDLDLSGNKFETVPECLFKLTSLTKINFRNNPLSEEAKAALKARMGAKDYKGPRIEIS